MQSLSHILGLLFWSDAHITYTQLQRVAMIIVSQRSSGAAVEITITTNALKPDILTPELLTELKGILIEGNFSIKGNWVLIRGLLQEQIKRDLIIEGVLGFCVLRPVMAWKLLIVEPSIWRRLQMVDHMGTIEQKLSQGIMITPEELMLVAADDPGCFWESKSVFASCPNTQEVVESVTIEFGLDSQAVNYLELAGQGWNGFGLIGFGPNVPKGAIGLMVMLSGRPVSVPSKLASDYQHFVRNLLSRKQITSKSSDNESLFPIISIPLADQAVGALIILSVNLSSSEELTLYSVEQEIPKAVEKLINSRVCPKYSRLLWQDSAHRLSKHQSKEFIKIGELVQKIQQLLDPQESDNINKCLLAADIPCPSKNSEEFMTRLVEVLTDQFCNLN